MSISGMTSLASFLLPFFAGPLGSLSTSISELDCRPRATSCFPIAASRALATFVDADAAGKVSAMTWERTSGVRRLRSEEMDRRALRENLASNRATARSNKAKLLLMSVDVVSG